MNEDLAKVLNLLNGIDARLRKVEAHVEDLRASSVTDEIDYFSERLDELKDELGEVRSIASKPLSEKEKDMQMLRSSFLSRTIVTEGTGYVSSLVVDGGTLKATLTPTLTMEEVKRHIASQGFTDKDRLATAISNVKATMMPRRITYSTGNDRAKDSEYVKNLTLNDNTGELFVTYGDIDK